MTATSTSLYGVAAALVTDRRRVLAWTILIGVIGTLAVWFRPANYVAAASFVLQNSDSRATGLASIAGQFGVSLGGDDVSRSPEFYSALVHSRSLLLPLAEDTLEVRELGGRRLPLLEIFEVTGAPEPIRDELGVSKLRTVTASSVNKTTGVVTVTASTKWPSVSLAIVRSLVQGLNDFNESTRQTQARAERQFVERQLRTASDTLRRFEDQLKLFERGNAVWSGSPDLRQQHERLERAVVSQQTVVTALRESFEQARIREVRDTPVLTLIETPWVSWIPESRGRLIRILLSLMLGLAIGIGFTLLDLFTSQRAQSHDAEALRLAVRSALNDLSAPIRRVRRASNR